MASLNVTAAQASAGLWNGTFRLGVDQLTFSIPGTSSLWPTYEADEEPSTGFALFSPAQADAFRSALKAWDGLILANFAELADDANTRGELRVAFTQMDADTAAYAYTGTPQRPGSYVGDVWFNVTSRAESMDAGTYNFEVLIHEIGHTLGLKHSFEGSPIPAPYENTRYTVMSYTDARFGEVVSFRGSGGGYEILRTHVTAITPMVLDVAAVQAIYGADPNTRSGADTYRFDQDAKTLQTLYDAGGDDTIDLSNFTRSSTVDLMPGSYSSLGIWSLDAQVDYWAGRVQIPADRLRSILSSGELFTNTDNVGIAFGTTIENATGGNAADTISGNAAANMLRGMGGDDVLLGLDGDDRLEGGAGNDVLTGGAGADVFVLTGTGLGDDRVTDFSMTQDRFDLGGLRFTDARNAGNGTELSHSGGIVLLAGTHLSLATANALVVGKAQYSPGLLAVLPNGDAPVQVGLDLRLLFAGDITRGSGMLTLSRADGVIVETFRSDSTRLMLTGNVLSIDPTRPLDYGAGYTLSVSPGSVLVVGVVFAGLQSASFSTMSAPLPAATVPYYMEVVDGSLATALGTGLIFGTTTGAQGVSVADVPGTVTLDPSFNAGGDLIRLSGRATDWSVQRSGSSAILSDGDTRVIVPIGFRGLDIQFADKLATLKIDAFGTSAILGDQSLTTVSMPVNVSGGAATSTATFDPIQFTQVSLSRNSAVAMEGSGTVFGTDGYETLRTGKGVTHLDASFNQGGDQIIMIGRANDYTVWRSGSTAIFTGEGQTVAVPVGIGRHPGPLYAGAAVPTATGSLIQFADGTRELIFKDDRMMLGNQDIPIGVRISLERAVQKGDTVDRDDDGTLATSFVISALDAAYRFIDNVATPQNVRITYFWRGDSLELGAPASSYVFSSAGTDLLIHRVGDNGSLSTIVLQDAADASIPVTSYASAVAAVGFDFATFTL